LTVAEMLAPRIGRLPTSKRRRLTTGAAALAVAAGVLARYHADASGFVAAFAAAVLVVLSVIDLEVRLVPNRIVVPAAVIVLAARIVLDPGRAWVWAAASVGAAFAFFVLAILRPGGLGMGDVKLVLLIGAAVGPAVIAALLVGTLAGAAYGLFLLVRHGSAAGGRTIAYVPFLALGALVALLLLRP
jgi:leader peptidase (prepilin peptidase) / N-methyltransferase